MSASTLSLDQISCQKLKGVGPKLEIYLKKIGILTIQDLLFHLPLRYENRTEAKQISQLKPGDHVLIVGEIIQTKLYQGRRTSFMCNIADQTGSINLRFFHFTTAQQQLLSQNHYIRCFGEVRWGNNGLEVIHPEFQCFRKLEDMPPVDDKLTPIYPATDGLHQFTLRKLTTQALQMLEQSAGLPEYLPDEILEKFALPHLTSAIHYVHKPPTDASIQDLLLGIHPAQQRLAFEELLAHQLSLAKLRTRVHQLSAPKLNTQTLLITEFLKRLPYQLTTAQQRVFEEIKKDLICPHPMLRLVQGDVGSGKTVVAALTILLAVETGYQGAIMAPTEILAEQHYRNFSQWFEPLGIKVSWLTSSLRGKMREEVLSEIESGKLQIIIGTHALFQKTVQFQKLAVVVIDEQHRFGVHQRLALREKGICGGNFPHQLIMTATPIPRTLAMAAYADLDCSLIDELPPGRTPITTVVIPNTRRLEVIERVKQNCLVGKQAYWVCTLIEESEILQYQAAEKIAAELTQSLTSLRVSLVHGRMKSEEKERIMTAFKAHEIDLLIATTVIEVGVDVPNASLMIIENAERLGLAQLHQLRGRVGRGKEKSHCVLMYQAPLSNLAVERLQVLKEHQDGFLIANKDLELRGPGEVLGTRQTGLIQLKIADLLRDKDHLPNIQKAATLLLNHYPDRIDPLIRRWLLESERFGEV